MNICENCGLVRTGNPSGFCDKCEALLDSQAEESLQNEEAAPQQVTDDDEVEESQAEAEKPSEDSANKPSPTSQAGLKEAALGGVAKAAIGSENVQKAAEIKARGEKAIATAHATVERTRWAAQTAISALGNPAFWIAILVVVVLFIVSNVAVTTNQTVGSMKDNSEGGSEGMASGVLARLAQRGTLLAQEAYKFPQVDPFVAAHGGDSGRTNGNAWNQACPDIVNIIYGMPELYIGNNGIVNAYQNYKRLTAAGLAAQSWWFPETSSPGATQTQPPAGAIVQATGSGPAGHTYVVLTDDGKVIDNTWTIRSGGPVAGPGYRILDDRSRAGIRGWFLPPAEGYEGTFLNEDPMLPAVPEWAQGSAEDAAGSGSGGPATVPAGSAQTIAKEMVTARGWDDSQFTCLVKLWTRESSWNVSAENSSSGAYGIPQALPGTKMASAGADWRTNPATQIKWGLDYISGRYSNPCGAWAHSEAKNWY